MASGKEFDLVVIGAGPAGYVAAIRGAQLGLSVALVEKNKSLGGTCLNVGCIPSKAMLESSHQFEAAGHHLADHGINVSGLKLDLKKMLSRKDAVVEKLTGGIAMLMKKNKIEVFHGAAVFKEKNTIEVGGKETLTGKNILIATGSTPIELPHMKFDHETVIDSTDALSLASVPKNMVVVGAGVIGLEMGSVWRRLGAKVTLIDLEDEILGVMDKDLRKAAMKSFRDQGLEFIMGAKVSGCKTTKTGARLTYEDKDGKEHTIKGDKVLVSVGRRPNTDKLGLAEAGVKTDNRGFIQIDENYKTSADGIYAVGDCVPGPMLAHKGSEEGVAAVEKIAGHFGHVNYNAIAWVVYTHPEVSGVGLTEDEAREKGLDYKVGKFSFAANGRALAMGETEGFVKIIADKKTDRLLGMHAFGANASELIAEGAIAIEFAGSAEDIARAVHAHPTMSESTKEAALAVDGAQIHG